MSSDHSLDAIKTQINLVEYVLSKGYQIDKRKTTRTSIALKNSCGDKVIVSRRNGIWVYFAVHDDSDNGTIFDFIHNRTKQSMPEIINELSGFSFGINKSDIEIPLLSDKSPLDPKRIQAIYSKCSVVDNHEYLNSRGIPKSLIHSPRFKGCIYKDRFNNVVFPHFKDQQVCGLELKNNNFGVFVRGSEKTFWRSNFLPSDVTVAIAETPIDALSYQAMFELKDVFYIATSGSVSKAQIKLIKEVIKLNHSIQGVLFISDNDKGGDSHFERFSKAIIDDGFRGSIKRHSPENRGDDWNEVLNRTQSFF